MPDTQERLRDLLTKQHVDVDEEGGCQIFDEQLALIEQEKTMAREEERMTQMRKFNEVYTEFEANKPPETWSLSEKNYNDGFYTGEMKAMEVTCRKLFGIDGEDLASVTSLVEKK